ncbi:hypothetical protein BGZ83_000034 [Gryganskiella cystojenkinii]|nr:hypothetical protein BGZ83_000034 [Gryganskiella cystojenkinii]
MACRILENCPKLEQFSSLATISFLDLMVQSPTDGEARPWICLGLRNLTIKFDLGTPEILQKETSPMDEGFFKKTIPLARSKMACLTRRNTGLPGKTLSDYDLKDRSRIVFGQLARLTRLEVLNISGSECCHDDGTSRTPQQRDLQFRSGYGLTMLDQLKQLHTIGFKRTDQILARKEIDWMLVNWPLLRYVEGQLNPVQSIHESLLAMLRNRKVGVGY